MKIITYIYIRKTLPHIYEKMNNNQLCALCSAMTDITQSLKSRKYPLPNFVVDLCIQSQIKKKNGGVIADNFKP